MSFTSGLRASCGTPAKADAQMDVLIANAEHVISKSAFSGAVVSQLSQNVPNTTTTSMSWSGSTWDTDAYFSGGSPTRLTVPAGISIVQLMGGYKWSQTTTDGHIWLTKNGAQFAGSADVYFDKQLTGSIMTGMLDVSAGDYFEFKCYHSTGLAITLRMTVSIRGIWT